MIPCCLLLVHFTLQRIQNGPFLLIVAVIAASAHARAAIYFEIDKEFPCRFVWMDGWMDGVYANEELACVQTLLSTARESQIGTRYTSLIRNFRVCLFVGMDGWSICK